MHFFIVLLLSAFFFGHIVTQFPGGWLANKYGGKLVFLIGVFITCVLTLLSPLVARTDFYLFVALRIVQGLAEVNYLILFFRIEWDTVYAENLPRAQTMVNQHEMAIATEIVTFRINQFLYQIILN